MDADRRPFNFQTLFGDNGIPRLLMDVLLEILSRSHWVCNLSTDGEISLMAYQPGDER
jgi:hypothetical protein